MSKNCYATYNRRTVNNLVATDAKDRKLSPVAGVRHDRFAGLFYFAWHGQFGSQTRVYDVTGITRENPEGLWDYDEKSEIAPLYANYYFNEPLYGYYNAADPYVIRKHIELFIAADIDFIAYDFTNAKIFYEPLFTMFELLNEYHNAGWSVPKVTFFTKRRCDILIKDLYDKIYAKHLYPHLWFTAGGQKPYIIAVAEDVPENIRGFFHIRHPQWPEDKFRPDGFPYVEKVRPQRLYTNLMNVSVAQHTGGAFSWSVNGPHGKIKPSWGRGYTSGSPENGNTEAIERGANFEEQWQHAIKEDPEIVFITGWNEWIAGKWYKPDLDDYGKIPYWVDTFNTEFSRDIEMTKSKAYLPDGNGGYKEEGYGDNYYIRLIHHVRQYKGIPAMKGNSASPVFKTIDFDDPACWNDVTDIYYNISTEKVQRDYVDFTQINRYTCKKPTNFIKEIRVCDDPEYIYFRIMTGDKINLPAGTRSNQLNLLIGFDNDNEPSFCGYQYAVNRYPEKENTSVEKSIGGYAFEVTGKAVYTATKNILQLKILKKIFGIRDKFTMHFKVADSIEKEDDIADYYVSGDSAPIGRLSYLYTTIFREVN